MTLRIVNTDMSGGGAQIDLLTTDDLFLTEGSVIASNGGVTSTVIGLGSHHDADIYGMVVGAGIGLTLGDTEGIDFDQDLYVAPMGVIRSFEDYAVEVVGYQSRIDNAGRIEGVFGLDSRSDRTTGATTIINSGAIIGRSGSAIHRAGTEDFTIENSGLLKGSSYAIHAASNTGDARIINTGRMVGLVTTSDGNDIYDGEGGRCDGFIFLGDGNDMAFGGRFADAMGGGQDKDRLTGAGGADQFFFMVTGDSAPAAADRDTITDFSHRQGDEINLSVIDAIPSSGTDDAFHFRGSRAFTATEGELRFVIRDGETLVQADTDGDRHADMVITLTGEIDLVRGDFVL